MPKGQRKYNGTQKVEIIKRIRRENLSFKGASREYGISDRTLRDWERIYWEEGEEALLLERRGRACAASGTQKGRKPKLDKQVEEDLIAENQRLRMEIDYLKKLNALVLEESTSSSGTKAEIPSESTAATCRTSSQHVLLLSAPVSESCQIPDGKGTDCYNLQREQKTIRIPQNHKRTA